MGHLSNHIDEFGMLPDPEWEEVSILAEYALHDAGEAQSDPEMAAYLKRCADIFGDCVT